jgi:hypothetical protein
MSVSRLGHCFYIKKASVMLCCAVKGGQIEPGDLAVLWCQSLLVQLAYSNQCAAEGWNPAGAPEVLLGVVASDNRLGLRALRDWCAALGLEYILPDSRVSGFVSEIDPVRESE